MPSKPISSSPQESAAEYCAQIVHTLSPHADPVRAPAMRAYMREQFPFLGISSPARRAACKEALKTVPDSAHLLARAQALWQLEEREYQYVAIDLLARHYKKLACADLPLLYALVQSKSWWDSVDGLAGVIGDVLRQEPDAARVAQEMDGLISHPDLWLRRIALLHQLGWREATDHERLFRYCRLCALDTDFFIRKAIGWALRDYARHAPQQVGAFLLEMGDKLSPLSRREAGKHL